MEKGVLLSAGSVLRAVALGAAFCALTAAPACGRQTFNLLNDNGGAGAQAVVSGGAGAGGGAGGAPSGGSDLDAGAGRAGSLGDRGGAGTGATDNGGGTQDLCLPGEECTDGGLACPPTVSFCNRCQNNSQCRGNRDAPFCDTQEGRCAQCRVGGDDCNVNEICDQLTLRCAPACSVDADCAGDPSRPLCDDAFGVCVSCKTAPDCSQFPGQTNDVCFFGSCEECFQDSQCPFERRYCVGLRCQTKH